VSDDAHASTRLLIGLVITGVGLGFTAIGLMFQKYALSSAQKQLRDELAASPQPGHRTLSRPLSQESLEEPDEEKKATSGAYFCSKWWMFGFAVFCLGNLLFWFGIALVPQVLLACWQCWAMIVTIFAAPFLLGEDVTIWKLGSVVTIMIGIVWVVLAAPQTYQAYTTPVFWKAIEGFFFISITAGIVFALMFLIGSVFFCKMRRRMSAIRYILIAAMINWYSVLCAKTSSGFFITTVYHNDSQVNSAEFWVLLGGMLTLAVANVHYLNRALEVGEAVFVVPVYESLAILGQILFAAVFFDEFKGLSMWEGIEIGCAISVVLAGVISASTKEPEDSKFLSTVVISPEMCPCFGKKGLLHSDDEVLPVYTPHPSPKDALLAPHSREVQKAYI